MILKRLKLENIRSYQDQEIQFPEGSVLLAGDIGSGKSTILIAVEFALFGLKLGELTGASLLSHGARSGSVELAFSIHEHEFSIGRTLKRGKDSITQDKGYIIEDGVQMELMPKELRAKILEILNYPESVQGKSQDLIYRFTVYTPQEEMKKILQESAESRLDTLRKVFNIDKYKRVQENAQIFAGYLREQSKEIQGKISDLEVKKNQSKVLAEQIVLLSEQERGVKHALDRLKLLTQGAKDAVASTESEMQAIHEMKKNFSVAEAQQKSLEDRKKRIQNETAQLAQDIARLKIELKEIPPAVALELQKKDIDARLDDQQRSIAQRGSDLAVLASRLEQIKKSMVNIRDLDTCSQCLQKVPHDHKQSVLDKSEKEIAQIQEQSKSLAASRQDAELKLSELRSKQKTLADAILKAKQAEIRKTSLEEKEKKSLQLTIELAALENESAIVLKLKQELVAKLLESSSLVQRHELAKQAFDSALLQERKQELVYNSVQKDKEAFERQKLALDSEIKSKELSKSELEGITRFRQWLQDRFVPFTSVLEKHVMLAIHQEFSGIFKRWFDILIEDDRLTVKLDDTFSVIMEQDGYESSTDTLSGGEKTSVALAYRLALNRVINDVLSTIRTKDLLILDEPTEGFSTEQLDKVRDVLEELDAKQVILVSHESKVESFVDSIIRIEKQDGLSAIR